MKILAIEKELENTDWTFRKEILEKEAHQVYQLYLSDHLREIYFNDLNCAVLILECQNIAKAEELLSTLPLVAKKLIKFEIMHLKPYTGFERIMETN